MGEEWHCWVGHNRRNGLKMTKVLGIFALVILSSASVAAKITCSQYLSRFTAMTSSKADHLSKARLAYRELIENLSVDDLQQLKTNGGFEFGSSHHIDLLSVQDGLRRLCQLIEQFGLNRIEIL